MDLGLIATNEVCSTPAEKSRNKSTCSGYSARILLIIKRLAYILHIRNNRIFNTMTDLLVIRVDFKQNEVKQSFICLH